MTPKEWVFGAGRGRPLEGLTRDDERTSRTSLLRALPRSRSSARDRPLARRVHGDKGGERRGERRRLRYPEGNGVRVCPTRGDVAFRGSRIDRQWKHRGAVTPTAAQLSPSPAPVATPARTLAPPSAAQ